jgi:hypothetical protein
MITRISSIYMFGIGLAVVILFMNSKASSDEIHGIVKEFAAKPDSNGLDGVAVTLKVAGNKNLLKGLTDLDGNYHVSFTGQRWGMTVTYDKIGYLPMKKEKVNTKMPLNVYLIRDNGDQPYYERVSMAVADKQLSSLPGGVREDALKGIVALPDSNRGQVLEHLRKAKEENILAEIKTIEENNKVVARIETRFREDPSLSALDVGIRINKRVVELTGVTPDKKTKTRAGTVAIEVSPGYKLLNTIEVAKSGNV